jgi:uncharacterized membrane protein (UPF0127 family)
MKVHIFRTLEGQGKGLQHVDIDPNTLYVFPLSYPGVLFHSRNVREPFDIAFLSKDMVVLKRSTIRPQEGTDIAPEGTFMAVESKAGKLSEWGFDPGRHVSF